MNIRLRPSSFDGPARSWRVRMWAAACVLPLIVVASGCAGTPWGERLSGSFPTPQGQSPQDQEPLREPQPSPEAPTQRPPLASPAGSLPGGAGRTTQTQSPSLAAPQGPGANASPPTSGGKPQGAQPSNPQAPKVRPSPSPGVPSPYRVTIRLPQADPSAPAEGVTQALRTAGIPFEVETIERVKGAAAPQPEATQGSAVAPSVRPAPLPR
jgi:hypothetical protein